MKKLFILLALFTTSSQAQDWATTNLQANYSMIKYLDTAGIVTNHSPDTARALYEVQYSLSGDISGVIHMKWLGTLANKPSPATLDAIDSADGFALVQAAVKADIVRKMFDPTDKSDAKIKSVIRSYNQLNPGNEITEEIFNSNLPE